MRAPNHRSEHATAGPHPQAAPVAMASPTAFLENNAESLWIRSGGIFTGFGRALKRESGRTEGSQDIGFRVWGRSTFCGRRIDHACATV